MDEDPRPASTDAPEPPTPVPWLRGRALALALALALGAVLVAVLGVVVAPRCGGDAGDAPGDGAAAAETGDAAVPIAAAPIRVRGRIRIEVPTETPAPVVIVDADTAHAGTDGGTEGVATEDVADDTGEAFTPPAEVATVTPAAGSCRVRAWQAGVAVAPTTSCDDEGGFEVELVAGTTGLVAFDLEVPGHLRAVVEAAAPESGIGRLPDVALGVGESVEGTVTDSRGIVVADLEITARPDPDLGEPEPWRVRSDATGGFRFDTLPPGPVILRVDAPGFAPTVLEVIAPESAVQLVLDRMYELEGDVIGPPDVLARTRARVEGSGVWPAREAALVDGVFRFPAIPEGVYALVAVAAAVNPGDPEFASIPLEDVAPDGHVTLALVPAHRVAVRVVDADDAPVVDARVTLGAAHLGLLQHHGRTDAMGQVALGPLPNGLYVVRADADGFLAAPGVEVAVVDAAPETLVLRLARPGGIRGIVVDEADGRVAEATIEVRSDTAFSVGESSVRRTTFERSLLAQGDAAATGGSLGVTTGPVPAVPDFVPDHAQGEDATLSDSDGAFRLDELPPGTYTLRAVHGRFAASDTVEVRVRAGATVEGVRLRLRGGFPLTGRLLDDNARPIADGWVELDDGSVYGTDDRGVFDAGLRRGDVVLVARAPGKAPLRRALEVRAALDVELELATADAWARGRVVDDNLRPLDGVQVTLRAASPLVPTEVTWTDARGSFEFGGIPTGEVSLSFDHAEYAPAVAEATAALRGRERAIEVVMVRGWTLVVDVRDRDTGVAIPDARVVVDGRVSTTDRGGLAEFAGLGDDALDVEVTSTQWGRRSARARRDGDRTTLVVELAEGGAVEGIVTDWAGDPVAGAEVVIKAGDAVVAEVRSDARGAFDAVGIPEGDIVLEAFPPADREDDLAPVAVSSDVLRGRTTRGLDLRFDRR